MTAEALFEIDTHKQWGVEFSEMALMACASPAAEYWLIHRPRWERSGQLKVLKVGAFGDVVRIGPFTRDDADFVCDHLIEKGAPKTAVKVKRVPKNEASDVSRGVASDASPTSSPAKSLAVREGLNGTPGGVSS